jgi:hypothetical protein
MSATFTVGRPSPMSERGVPYLDGKNGTERPTAGSGKVRLGMEEDRRDQSACVKGIRPILGGSRSVWLVSLAPVTDNITQSTKKLKIKNKKIKKLKVPWKRHLLFRSMGEMIA